MGTEAQSSAVIPGFLPWQLDAARQWLGQRERFAHAWLIQGLAGIGKRRFAWAAAASLLCESPQQGLACGRCSSCHWLGQGNHPDFRVIRPDAVTRDEGAPEPGEPTTAEGATPKTPSREIRIEQVREIEHWIGTATHRGGNRIILLYPLESMNAYAANALLKMLEEPPANTIFLLVSDAPDRVLPTLLSRCRRLPLGTPEPSLARSWLAEHGLAQADGFLAAAGGAPVAALQASQTQEQPWPSWLPTLLASLRQGQGRASAASLANDFDKIGAAQWLPVLQRAAFDLQLVCAQLAPRYYPALQQHYQALAPLCGPVALANLVRHLNRQMPWVSHPLNGRLFAQSTLLQFADIFTIPHP